MSKDKDRDLKLGPKDGAILFLDKGPNETAMNEFIIPEGDDKWSEAVRETMAFFMYATQRDDWIAEFDEKMDYLMGALTDIENAVSSKSKKSKKPKLKLMKEDEGEKENPEDE